MRLFVAACVCFAVLMPSVSEGGRQQWVDEVCVAGGDLVPRAVYLRNAGYDQQSAVATMMVEGQGFALEHSELVRMVVEAVVRIVWAEPHGNPEQERAFFIRACLESLGGDKS